MANGVFNNARGRIRELLIDGGDLIVVLLKVAQAEATLVDHDTLSALLAAANTEADFTNYARKTISNGAVTITVDDTNERLDIDFADQEWASAGGASNNTLVKLLVCQDGANDAARIPLTHHDFAVTTDGNTLIARPASAGFYRSA